jgi:hypothetical protein
MKKNMGEKHSMQGKQEAYRRFVSENSEEERNGKNKGNIDLRNIECKIVC